MASLPDALTEGHERLRLDSGWEMASAEPGADPTEWIAARVPGTAAGALRDAGLWPHGEAHDFDACDWWFRTMFVGGPAVAGEEVVLQLGGIATVAEVWLNGQLLLESESMFARHELDVGDRLEGTNELVIRCCALERLLRERRKPRARWRTRLADSNLRFFRTALLGRAPGFAPTPAPVGPWRPVAVERRRQVVLDELTLLPRLDGDDGVLDVSARVRSLGGRPIESIQVEVAGQSVSIPVADGVASGSLRLQNVARWWPHTHGRPELHEVRLLIGPTVVATRRVGFRSLGLGLGYDIETDDFAFVVNGVDVFIRGALWTPVDFVALAADPAHVRDALQQVCDAGMNMLRLPGTSTYEDGVFHDLCDQLGLLVWQDFMFANFDYPFSDEHFAGMVEQEARDVLRSLAGRPSLAVLCGNSEVEQQAAMVGLDPSLIRAEFFATLLPRWAKEAGIDVPYVPSAPSGGDLPFRFDRGVSNYYGVGCYLRPLEDARLAAPRFAAECLAFGNVPDAAALEAMGLAGVAVHEERWKAGVPHEPGVGWDFDDVRDWYLKHLFEVDPVALRVSDHARYLELSRAVSGEVMADAFGNWRRPGSLTRGGLVLWLRDLAPGAGFGLIDASGTPKAALHHLRRALNPVAIWTTDEGMAGVDVHVANDRGEALSARIRVALYRDSEIRVEEAIEEIALPAGSSLTRNLESIIGRFVDASWAYRFGPPGHNVIVASLEEGDELLSQAFRFPVGRPATIESATRLGLEARATRSADGRACIHLASTRLTYGLRIVAPGFEPEDDAFSLEPGGARLVVLRARAADAQLSEAFVTALNLEGRVHVAGQL
jgi:beta-mannosidase